jgi:hypothetical protein
MASRQTQRTPHNVYTQKRADQQFQDFVQYSKSKNLPIPNGLASSSKRSQAIDDNHLNAPKRQKIAPGQVHLNFLFFFPSSLMLFFSSLSWIRQAQIWMETKPFPLLTTTWLMTRIFHDSRIEIKFVYLFIRPCFFISAFFSSLLYPLHRTLQCCLYPIISVFLLGSVQSIQFCSIHQGKRIGLSLKIIISDRSRPQWDWMLPILPHM